MAFMAIAGLASSLFSAAKQSRQMKENQEMIAQLQGATPQMTAGQENLQSIANQLGSGQGVSDITFNRATANIQENAAQQVAQAIAGARESIMQSPMVFDQLAEQAMAQSRQMLESGQDKLTQIDVEAAMSNLKTSAGVQAQAFDASSVIKKFEDAMFQQKLDLESKNAQMYSGLMTSLGKATGTFFEEGGAFDSEVEDTNILTTEEESLVEENKVMDETFQPQEDAMQNDITLGKVAEDLRSEGDVEGAAELDLVSENLVNDIQTEATGDGILAGGTNILSKEEILEVAKKFKGNPERIRKTLLERMRKKSLSETTGIKAEFDIARF